MMKAVPSLVTGGLQEGVKVDAEAAMEQMLESESQSQDPAADDLKPEGEDAAEDDPAKALEADMKANKK